jgi:hypothetical protein
MKAIFGMLSLVIALAIVASLAKKQLQAVGLGGGSPTSIVSRSNEAARQAAAVAADPGGDRDGATLAIPGGMPGAVAADPNGDTVPIQARNIENQVRDNAVRAMQQGMKRNERADP